MEYMINKKTNKTYVYIKMLLGGNMKSIIAILALLTLSNAFAKLTPASTWDEINNTDGVRVSLPYVTVEGLNLFVTFDKFCHDGDMLRTGETFEKCVKFQEFNNDSDLVKCIEFKTFPVLTPATYTYNKCVEWAHRRDESWCVDMRTFTGFHAQTKNVTVYKEVVLRAGKDTEDITLVEMFSKDFTIPSCK